MSDPNVAARHIEEDQRFIEEGRRLARPLNADEIAQLSSIRVPSALDYSQYVTFIRNQNGGGGCGTMSSLAILDILKERERPASPDFSYKFAMYIYNAAKWWPEYHPDWQADPRVPYDPEMNQLKALQQYGCCSEASYPSNYDASSVAPGDPPPPSEWPSDENFAEAKQYRIFSYSQSISKPGVEDLKAMLVMHGPVFLVDLIPGHVVTLIGYDDNRGGFWIVNSWGDQWGTNGMEFYLYSDYAVSCHTQNPPWVRWVDNYPTSPSVHPFTARIKLHHQDKRNRLTISIGVMGQDPMVIWDRPQVRVRPDNSKDLTLDVPLPSYAQEHWPPSERNSWYVRIEDHEAQPTGSHPTVGKVHEITLVQRLTPPVLYRASATEYPIIGGGSTDIYIPLRKHYLLDLVVSPAQTPAGGLVVFSGTFTLQLDLSDQWHRHIPQPNKVVTIVKVTPPDPDPQFIDVGDTMTDANGRFQLSYIPTETAEYLAWAKDENNLILASYGPFIVTVE